MTANVYWIREKIEDILYDKIGFYVPLQENDYDEDEGFQVYLHSESYNDLTDDQIDKLDKLGFTEDPDDTNIILNFLNVSVT